MVVFDPAAFKISYPQFAAVGDEYLTEIFDNEVLTVWSGILNLFVKDTVKLHWGNLILAHLLTLQPGTGAGGDSSGTGITGTVASAGEGKVSAGFTTVHEVGSRQWWTLTAYGQRIWSLLSIRGGATYFPMATNSLNIAGNF